MGRVFDLSEVALVVTKGDVSKTLDKDFMMNVFEELHQEPAPFQEHHTHICEEKKSHVVNNKKVKIILLKLLHDKLFHPQQDTNMESTNMTKVLGGIIADGMPEEMCHPGKAILEHMSKADRQFLWDSATEEDKMNGLGKPAVNDIAESSFGAMTQQLHNCSTISLTGAAAIGESLFFVWVTASRWHLTHAFVPSACSSIETQP